MRVYKLVEYFLHYFSIIDIADIDCVYQACDSKLKNPDGVTTQIKNIRNCITNSRFFTEVLKVK